MKRSRLAFALGASLLAASSAHAANYFDYQDIYHGAGAKLYAVGEVGPGIAFRIPAIASMGNGVLITAADVRYAGSTWSDLVAGTKICKTKLSTKISYDGGLTWSDLSILNAKDGSNGANANDYEALATDPAMVYNNATNTVLMFGLRNNVNLNSGVVATGNPDGVTGVPQTQQSDFVMLASNDQGKTWSSRSIYKEVLIKLMHTLAQRSSLLYSKAQVAVWSITIRSTCQFKLGLMLTIQVQAMLPHLVLWFQRQWSRLESIINDLSKH